MTVRILIDATFVRNRTSGVERYALSLVRELSLMECDYEFTILVSKNEGRWDDLAPRLKIIRSPFQNRILTDQVWVPYILWRLKPQIAHFLAFSPPLICPVVPITTIHDAVFWEYPNTLSVGGRLYYKPLLELGSLLGRLKYLVTDSESSREGLLRYLPRVPQLLSVVYLGVDRASVDYSPNSLNRTIVTLGTLEPRKNIACLIEAFRIARASLPGLKLIVIGRPGWGNTVVPNSGLEDIVFTGPISDHEIGMILSNASVFVLPSKYEGFGLPLLEAMSIGVPCIASHASSLPEVGGAACLYADPNSPSDFAEKIERLIADPDLARELSELSKERASIFSWRDTASETVKFYREVLNGQST